MTKTPSTPKTTTKKRKTHDWERIELDYRAGVKSLREMAKEHGCTDGAIRKRAKRDGWTRDLSKKIQDKSDELVRTELVRSKVRTKTDVSERETIDANAHAIAEVKTSHRRDITRTRNITMALLEELELQTGAETVALLEQLGEAMRQEDDKGQDRLNDLYRKVVSLPGRAKTMKDLGESLRVLVTIERQAYGLDDKDNAPTDGLTSLLHGISKSSGNAFKPVTDDPELAGEDEGSALPMSPDGED